MTDLTLEGIELRKQDTGPPAIDVRKLTKRYGDLAAVDGVDFSVAQGEVFAFLGPNGAGKSTTIKMLCTLAHPTSGGARVAGFDVVSRAKAVRRHIGLVFQEQTLDDQLTAEENLRFHAVLYGVPHDQVGPRITRVMDLVALSDRRKDLVSTYSGGMARRLEIARGMLHTPKVLFLDEPTIGLDPQTRALMWEDVLRLRDEEGVTIFLTTHYMDEAEQLCDRLVVMDQGSIVAEGAPRTLIERFSTREVVELRFMTDDHEEYFDRLSPFAERVEVLPDRILLYVNNGDDTLRDVHAAHITPSSALVRRSSLEDVFLNLTGRSLTE